MINVYLVADTRLHLPSTRWAQDVLCKLAEQGHNIRDMGPAPECDTRTEEEKVRVHQLLDSTGL